MTRAEETLILAREAVRMAIRRDAPMPPFAAVEYVMEAGVERAAAVRLLFEAAAAALRHIRPTPSYVGRRDLGGCADRLTECLHHQNAGGADLYWNSLHKTVDGLAHGNPERVGLRRWRMFRDVARRAVGFGIELKELP